MNGGEDSCVPGVGRTTISPFASGKGSRRSRVDLSIIIVISLWFFLFLAEFEHES